MLCSNNLLCRSLAVTPNLPFNPPPRRRGLNTCRTSSVGLPPNKTKLTGYPPLSAVLTMTPLDLRSPDQKAFYEELRQRGYVEGQNLIVERRNVAGQPDQLPSLARELVALRPDLIVASGLQPSLVINLKTATALGLTIPQSLRVQAELIE